MFGLLLLALFVGDIGAHDIEGPTSSCPGILNIDFDAKWGPADKIEDTSIRPFKIEFKPEMVDDLRYRLKNRRFAPAFSDVNNFEFGVNPDELECWLDYWENKYNFTEREEFLNEFPHFVTDIKQLTIHFIHIVPEETEGKIVLPLLMLHGFPGSFREFYSSLSLLTQPSEHSDYVFEVIAPSLPGFGFSDPAVRPGMGAVEMAIILKDLMNRLGHKHFLMQGGDLGALIAAYLATIHPEVVWGLHTNMGVALTKSAYSMITLGSIFPQAIMNADVVDRLYPLSSTLYVFVLESGFFHIQAAKPDTLGVGLTDSPSGLFTWICQQFSSASNRSFIYLPDGGWNTFTPEELIDNVMIYWTSKCITTAMRIYAETANKRNWRDAIFDCPTPVPTAVTQAIGELLYMPPTVLNTKYTNLVNVEVLDFGGHFLAMEQPVVFAEQVHKGIQYIMEFRAKNNMTCTLETEK